MCTHRPETHRLSGGAGTRETEMGETKHTPGPWETKPEEVDRSYIRIRGTRAGARYKIANVLTPVYDGSPEREANETRANARLIAVAPDLLESLCLLVDAHD